MTGRHTLPIAATAFALFLVMVSGEAWASWMGLSGGFWNFVSSLSMLFAMIYALMGARGFYTVHSAKNVQTDLRALKTKSSVLFFTGCSVLVFTLIVFQFAPKACSGLECTPEREFWIGVLYKVQFASVLFPWILMFFFKAHRKLALIWLTFLFIAFAGLFSIEISLHGQTPTR